jgi:hypothetical protein
MALAATCASPTPVQFRNGVAFPTAHWQPAMLSVI